MPDFNYKNNNIHKNQFDATIDNYTPFYNWLHNVIQPWNLSEEIINKIDLCAEEIFINISSYAYLEKRGKIDVLIDKNNDEIILQFTDTGFAYNPLEKPDPDITLPPEKRPLGGLGVYMMKQVTKKVSYERSENKNILTMTFDCV